MFSALKKSLRAKFTIVILFIGIIPLAGVGVFFFFTAKDALFESVFKELKWKVDEISGIAEGHFEQSRKDLLIAARNTAFTMYFRDPAHRDYWKDEQHRTLKYLRGIYPDMLDEACFIGADGKEVSRIVFDDLAPEKALSSDEDRNQFFLKSFALSEGEVFQGRPVMSEDSERWVLPNATPIYAGGKKAILHFEITMNYFQRLLKKYIEPGRGYGFILDQDGRILAHSQMHIDDKAPFPAAITESTPPDLKNIYGRMLKGEAGIDKFELDGKENYIIFRPVNTQYRTGRNENRWSVGYVMPSERIYVELDIMKYNTAALAFTITLAIILSYLIGNYLTRPIRELAAATDKVSAGEMPRISVDREDELGTLSRSFNSMVESIRRRDEALRALAITDGLTGIFNYRHFKAELERNVKASSRFVRPLSLLMADVDQFKIYNDANGHAQGDMALKKIAEVFLKNTREVDIAARYGGEEFAVILPETNLNDAIKAAERIRRKVEEELASSGDLPPNSALTISIGAAAFPENAADAPELVEAADKALYRAKDNGRNQVWPHA